MAQDTFYQDRLAEVDREIAKCAARRGDAETTAKVLSRLIEDAPDSPHFSALSTALGVALVENKCAIEAWKLATKWREDEVVLQERVRKANEKSGGK